jgi:hypothetical protein
VRNLRATSGTHMTSTDIAPVTASEHPLLANIRAGIGATGWHTQRWAELRREVFPGEASWPELKSWCDANEFDCQMGFTQSSRAAEVQFSKLRKKSAPAA